MVKRRDRKVVYVPRYMWQLLDEDAGYERETVTYVLKQILLNHYPTQRILQARGNPTGDPEDLLGNNKSTASTEKVYNKATNEEEEVQEY